MTKKKNIPDIRFKGFSEEWEEYTLGELGSVVMNKRIFKNQTLEDGDIPFYKIGTFGGLPNAFISRDLFEEYKSKYPYPEKGDILISASGSIGRIVEYLGKDEYFQDSNIVWLQHDNRIQNSFLKYFYSVVKWSGLEGSTIKRLYNKNILDTYISLPQPKEQTKIGNYFKNLDQLITQHQQKYDKLLTIKKAMLKKMFPQNGAKVPEIRFKGFSGEWEEKSLGEIASITMGQSPNGINYTDNPEDYILVQGNADIKNDMVVPRIWTTQVTKTADKGDLIFTVRAPVGEIGKTKYKVVIGRGVAAIKGNEFIFQSLKRMNEDGYWGKLSAGSTFDSINSADLSTAIMSTTNTLEQEAIGNFFKDFDNLIILNKQKLQKLKNIKKAFLDKMFV